ncbi:MAG TPA: C40 family peptidase [Candidatus Rubrimentiphilum sp.]|nr:C40 family peptidase [Candidatus Rubrimentiphilum sp.]
MRYLVAPAALAFLLAGSNAFAQANPTLPATHVAVSAAELASSPDVAQWTGITPHPVTHAAKHHDIVKFASRLFTRTARIANTLTRSALRFLGTPYVFGGTSGYGFDCSGYVQHVYAMLGVHLPRTADAQYYAGRRTVGGIRIGDLVFFQTYEPGPSHVGIYLGHGHFAHASSSHGVMVSSLSDSYWSARYIGAKRVMSLH